MPYREFDGKGFVDLAAEQRKAVERVISLGELAYEDVANAIDDVKEVEGDNALTIQHRDFWARLWWQVKDGERVVRLTTEAFDATHTDHGDSIDRVLKYSGVVVSEGFLAFVHPDNPASDLLTGILLTNEGAYEFSGHAGMYSDNMNKARQIAYDSLRSVQPKTSL